MMLACSSCAVQVVAMAPAVVTTLLALGGAKAAVRAIRLRRMARESDKALKTPSLVERKEP